jgi:hypothetical protein
VGRPRKLAERGARHLGRLIVFEGPDGVGKTTLAARLAERLATTGRCAAVTLPRRATKPATRIRLDVRNDQALRIDTPLGLAALELSAQVDAVEKHVLPALRSGVDVVLDGWWWTPWVRWLRGGLGRESVEHLAGVHQACWREIAPTLIVLVRRTEPLPGSHDDPADWANQVAEYDRLASALLSRSTLLVLEDPTRPSIAIDEVAAILSTIDVKGDSGPRGAPRPSSRSRAVGETRANRTATPVVPLLVVQHLSPAKVTRAYDTYWRFAAERQAIFYRRIAGRSQPWTDDPILSTFKFTNAYRVADRVSQYLIRRVIYDANRPGTPEEVCFRILLFKIFNKISTWELLERTLGPITWAGFRADAYDRVLTAALAAGDRIYSAAYIMPPGSRAFGHSAKHRNHLELIVSMMCNSLPSRLAESRTMQDGYSLLISYPTIGPFLAYQLITDINYSSVTNYSEMEFVMPGPGALSGIRKCFADTGGLNEAELIRFVAERQESEFERLHLTFESLWGRPLQLIDCQNLFCEVDKYSRVAHPDIEGRGSRTQIKQRYTQSGSPVDYWFPPKWQLNDRVHASLRSL